MVLLVQLYNLYFYCITCTRLHFSLSLSCFLIQLIEKAEAREKERLKEEARKVCVTVHMFV